MLRDIIYLYEDRTLGDTALLHTYINGTARSCLYLKQLWEMSFEFIKKEAYSLPIFPIY
jgi:hypothetical protein